jgi:hypothetical protein
MSSDPFAGLTETFQDRKQRDSLIRKQKWMAFWASLGATALVATATGVGGACGGWIVERNPSNVLDRVQGGMVCGLAGGVFLFISALWWVMRKSVVNDVLGVEKEIDIGATLFWAAVAGAIQFGSVGAALGLTGKGTFRLEVLACAVAAALLALFPAAMLRNVTRRKSRTGSGSATYRKRD